MSYLCNFLSLKYPIHVYRLGLGVVPGKQSFSHKNERNDQERSDRSENNNKRREGVLKNVGTICKGT